MRRRYLLPVSAFAVFGIMNACLDSSSDRNGRVNESGDARHDSEEARSDGGDSSSGEANDVGAPSAIDGDAKPADASIDVLSQIVDPQENAGDGGLGLNSVGPDNRNPILSFLSRPIACSFDGPTTGTRDGGFYFAAYVPVSILGSATAQTPHGIMGFGKFFGLLSKESRVTRNSNGSFNYDLRGVVSDENGNQVKFNKVVMSNVRHSAAGYMIAAGNFSAEYYEMSNGVPTQIAVTCRMDPARVFYAGIPMSKLINGESSLVGKYFQFVEGQMGWGPSFSGQEFFGYAAGSTLLYKQYPGRHRICLGTLPSGLTSTAALSALTNTCVQGHSFLSDYRMNYSVSTIPNMVPAFGTEGWTISKRELFPGPGKAFYYEVLLTGRPCSLSPCRYPVR